MLFSEFNIVSVDIFVSRVSVISMTSEPEILLQTSKYLLLSEILSLLGSKLGGALSPSLTSSVSGWEGRGSRL